MNGFIFTFEILVLYAFLILIVCGMEMYWQQKPIMPLTVILSILPGLYLFNESWVSFEINSSWKYVILCFAALIFWEHIIWGLAYEKLVIKMFPEKHKFYSPAFHINNTMKNCVNSRFLTTYFSFLLIVWAPLAENIFYWGILGERLYEATNLSMALLIPPLFLGSRHALHFLHIRRKTPYPAMLLFGIISFGSSLILGVLFFGSQSMAVTILAHFLSNLIWAGMEIFPHTLKTA